MVRLQGWYGGSIDLQKLLFERLIDDAETCVTRVCANFDPAKG
jgi:hypothetical protein